MTINVLTKEIKCDTVFCTKYAKYEINAKSYKGLIFLCDNCFKQFEKLFKKVNKNAN